MKLPLTALPVPDRLAWGCLGVGVVGLLTGLIRYWGTNPSHADRLLVLAGAIWAAWQLRPTFIAAPVRPRPWLGLPLVALGAVAVPLAWFLLARLGPRPLLLWWQLLGLMLAAAGLLLARAGWSRLRAVAFPLVFTAFALPIPDPILSPLQGELQKITTSCAHSGLTAVGVEVERQGAVLRLPGGDLGVAEACSGIRSLTALTALAAFVAYQRGFGPVRGLLLVTLSVPVVVAVNVFRVILSGLIQEYLGAAYVTGDWHEALGLAMVLLGLGLILAQAELLGNKAPSASAAPTETLHPILSRWPGWVAAGLLIGSLLTVGGAIGFGQSAAGAARSAPALDDFPNEFGVWKGTPKEIPAAVPEMLVYDAAIYRVYKDNLGREAHVWVIYWTAASVVRGYHHPDVCWPSRGFEIRDENKDKWTEPIAIPGGATVPATARLFRRRPDNRQQFVLFWTQDGNRVGKPGEESTPTFLDSQGWVRDFLGLNTGSTAPRLWVLVASPTEGAVARAEVAKLAAQVGAAVYALCPWANPHGGS